MLLAAHMVYEESRPVILYRPGKCFNMANTAAEALTNGRTVRVRGLVVFISINMRQAICKHTYATLIIGYPVLKSFREVLEIISNCTCGVFEDTATATGPANGSGSRDYLGNLGVVCQESEH
jgi:hypothetical protein